MEIPYCDDCEERMKPAHLYAGQDYYIKLDDDSTNPDSQPEVEAWVCPICRMIKLRVAREP